MIGALAKGSENGEEYRITANKCVVLATGGFSANTEMLKKYNESWDLPEQIMTTNRSSAQGDGIVMALGVGAKLEDMSNIMLMPLADPVTGVLSMVGPSNGLFVNKQGKRFVNESLSRAEITRAEMQQTDQLLYIISDANNSGITDGKTSANLSVEDLIQEGRLYRGDTLTELAEAIGVDPSALVDTVNSFNEMVATSVDPEFGRKLFPETVVIEKGPFYACPRTFASHVTMGGVAINENYQVLSEDGTAIKGLYAGGEVAATGGLGSSIREGYYIGKTISSIN